MIPKVGSRFLSTYRHTLEGSSPCSRAKLADVRLVFSSHAFGAVMLATLPTAQIDHKPFLRNSSIAFSASSRSAAFDGFGLNGLRGKSPGASPLIVSCVRRFISERIAAFWKSLPFPIFFFPSEISLRFNGCEGHRPTFPALPKIKGSEEVGHSRRISLSDNGASGRLRTGAGRKLDGLLNGVQAPRRPRIGFPSFGLPFGIHRGFPVYPA